MNFDHRLGMTTSADGRAVELDAGDAHMATPDTVHFAVLATGVVAIDHRVDRIPARQDRRSTR